MRSVGGGEARAVHQCWQTELLSLVTKCHPFSDPKILLLNQLTIGTFFHQKYRRCKTVNLGSPANTVAPHVRRLTSVPHTNVYSLRVAQHRGKSHWVGEAIADPAASSVMELALACGVEYGINNLFTQ